MSTVFIPKHIRPMHESASYKDCALFHELTIAERETLEGFADQTKCKASDYLFRQNAPADNVYNVISGTVAVERVSNNGRRQVLGFLFPGDYLGITHTANYDCAVRCLTKTEVYKFSRKRLYSLAEELPHLKTNIAEVSSRIFSRILDQLYILGQKKAHERLCFLFMQLLERSPGARPDRIELYMTRQDMADYLGLTIETVSRSLAKLKADGLIAFHRLNELQILDLATVSELADT